MAIINNNNTGKNNINGINSKMWLMYNDFIFLADVDLSGLN